MFYPFTPQLILIGSRMKCPAPYLVAEKLADLKIKAFEFSF